MILLITFGLGVIFQYFLMLGSLLRKKDTWIYLCCIFVICLLAFYPVEGEKSYHLFLHWLASIFVSMWLFSTLFKQELLPTLNHNSLIAYNTLFLTTYFLNLKPQLGANLPSIYLDISTGIIIFFTIAVLINALIKKPTPRWCRVIFYVWYLCISAVLVISVILKNKFFIANTNPKEILLATFSLGMLFVNFMLDITNIFSFIPWNKGESSEQYNFLSTKYAEMEKQPLNSFVLFIVLLGFLILNHKIIKIDEQIIICFVFALARLILAPHSLQRVIPAQAGTHQ